ncbi:MAG: hypothetical protein QNK20_03310 [Aureibaculum sp.]|nr:hypothetical protein [Aureibaculum sp.]
MKLALQLDQVNLSLFEDMWQELLKFMPKLIAVIAVLIIGWLLIKIVSFLIKKALKFSKIDILAEKLQEIDIFKNVSIKPTIIVVKVVKWILLLLMLIIISDILGLQMLTDGIASFIGYLPRLFSAIAILMIGIYIANIIKNAIKSLFKSLDLGGSNVIGSIVFFAIVVIVAITALNQAGIDTEMITSNLTLILGSLLLAFTIAFGLGSKEIVQRLLFGFYSRKNLNVGQKIKIGGIEGTIEAIDNIYLTLITDDGKFIFPIKEVNDTIIQVMDKK